MTDDAIIYEQPLNELIRVCLRLEKAFLHLDYRIDDLSSLGSHEAITSIIHILHVLDRPDLKAKLAKELSGQIAILQRLQKTPSVDHDKLKSLLNELDFLMNKLINSNGKLLQNLRDIELLNNLRTHLTTPGGGCGFDIPVYHYWLELPNQIRSQMLNSWIKEFEHIRATIFIITQLLREATKLFSKEAEHGFYQELLDPQLNLKLIRVGLSRKLETFPEISVGRHFLSIRFFTPDVAIRPHQFTETIPFTLAYSS